MLEYLVDLFKCRRCSLQTLFDVQDLTGHIQENSNRILQTMFTAMLQRDDSYNCEDNADDDNGNTDEGKDDN